MIKNIIQKVICNNTYNLTLSGSRIHINKLTLFNNFPKFNFARKGDDVDDMFRNSEKKEKKPYTPIASDVKKSKKSSKKPKDKDEEEKIDGLGEPDLEMPKSSVGKTMYDDILKETEEKKPAAPSSGSKITTKVLCDIIGTKHYPINEEIELPPTTFIALFDENDKLIAKTSLSQAMINAENLGKDIVLRNAKSNPPICKMMKYKIELIKRLMKKVGKNLGKEFEGSNKEEFSTKYMAFSLKMDQKDFNTKLDKVRQILAENPIIKIVIPIDLNSNEQTVKATSILKNIEVELYQMGKIRAGPIKQRKKDDKIVKISPKKKHAKREAETASQEDLENDYYQIG